MPAKGGVRNRKGKSAQKTGDETASEGIRIAKTDLKGSVVAAAVDKIKGPVEYFRPFEYESDIKSIKRLVNHTAEGKVNARLFRLICVALVPMIQLILLALYRDGLGVNFMFGASLLCMFTAYFAHIFGLFFTAVGGCCSNSSNKKNDTVHKSLFRVYSLSSVVPDCSDMSICYRALLFKYHAITSISEFSAIQGGIAQIMLLIISSYSWVVILCAMAPEVHKQGFGILSIGDVCEFVGCFGLVTIGTFELDPWNPTMQKFHNTGAIVGSLTLIGFLYQQFIIATHETNNGETDWSRLILPVTMIIAAVIAWVSWNNYSKKADTFDPLKDNPEPTDEEVKEIRNTVTKISFGNVTSEAVLLYAGASSMCLWLMYFDRCHQYNSCRM